MKIIQKTFNLTVEVSVQVGELKAIVEAQIWVYNKLDDGTRKVDVDFLDTRDITYMGIEIDGYKNWHKFTEFHKGMGIDFNRAIHDKCSEIMSDEAVQNLVKDIVI
jgi:hypothetical protein